MLQRLLAVVAIKERRTHAAVEMCNLDHQKPSVATLAIDSNTSAAVCDHQERLAVEPDQRGVVEGVYCRTAVEL